MRAVGGSGADCCRVFGETAGAGHHADIGLLTGGGWWCCVGRGGLPGGKDGDAENGDGEGEREGQGYAATKRDDFEAEAIGFHGQSLVGRAGPPCRQDGRGRVLRGVASKVP